MYTYSRFFVGTPLSQVANLQDVWSELSNLIHEADFSRHHVKDFLDNPTDPDYEVSPSLFAILTTLAELNPSLDDFEKSTGKTVDFEQSYHGADDAPVILGFYVDNLISIPSFGCYVFDFNDKKRQKVNDYITMLSDILAPLKLQYPVNLYVNNHSS